MGSGIALLIAQNGINVIMFDKDSKKLEEACINIDNNLQKLVSKSKISKEKRDEIMSFISISSDIKDLKDSELTIEAIFEDFTAT